MPVGSRFTLGPFELEFVSVTHSIPEPTALLIETKEGRVLHSGDWKIDRTPVLGQGMDEKRLREIGDKGVDVLVCDSTNVLREGFSPSEADVAERIAAIVKQATGRVAVTTFASHLDRIATVDPRRARHGPRGGDRGPRHAQHHRGGTRLRHAERFRPPAGRGGVRLPPARQGDAALHRKPGRAPRGHRPHRGGHHPHVSLDEGDLVIFSSKTIPGNEKEVSRVLNNLARLDIDVITGEDELVHSSGHPRQGELAMLYEWVRPKALIPMHGEPRHLRAHRDFAEEQGIRDVLIPRDGHITAAGARPAGAHRRSALRQAACRWPADRAG